MNKRKNPKGKRTDKTRLRSRSFQFIIILLGCLLLYGNSIPNGYNIDDAYVVSLDSANPLTAKGIKGIPEILTSRYSEGTGVTYGYRPLNRITLAIEYELWGNNPYLSHAINVFLYALNIFLLLIFLDRISVRLGFHRPLLIYLGLFIFLVHPIHTEVVCSIKNREEILCFTLMMASLLFFMRFREKGKFLNFAFFSVFAGLAVLAKESALNLIGLVIGISAVYAIETGGLRKGLRSFIAKFLTRRTIFILVVGIMIVSYVLTDLPQQIRPDDIQDKFEQNPYLLMEDKAAIPMATKTIMFYVKKLVFPYPLGFYYGYNMLPAGTWSDPVVYLGLSLLVISVFLGWKWRSTPKGRYFGFWLFFFLVTILPFSNIYHLYVTGTVAERLVYQASFGFSMIGAWIIYSVISGLLERLGKMESVNLKRSIILVALLIGIPSAVWTLNRNEHWESKLTLYRQDIKYLSNSARANLMLANSLMRTVDESNWRENSKERKNHLKEARTHYRKALTVYPAYDEAWWNLGRVYANYYLHADSALLCLLNITTNDKFLYANAQELIGDIHRRGYNNPEMALEAYLRGFEANPDSRTLYDKSIRLLFTKRDFETIYELSGVAVRNGWNMGFMDRADALYELGRIDEAIPFYETVIESGILNQVIQDRLTEYWRKNNDTSKLKFYNF